MAASKELWMTEPIEEASRSLPDFNDTGMMELKRRSSVPESICLAASRFKSEDSLPAESAEIRMR
ncbi:hypothetical protein E4U21_006907 [Claviceps maximensis]|nr:hypothetical protein E4U21_006907 [Claviceps maximensis]